MPGRVHSRGGFFSKISRRAPSDIQQTTIRDTGSGSAQTSNFLSMVEQLDTFSDIKAKCIQNGTLWEDPDFKPVASSIFFKTPPSVWPNVQWKRPREICPDPQMFVGGASRMDVVQGILGDCWLLAAVAGLAINQQLLQRVVLPDQDFQNGYAGIFRFQFWQYGRWVEVLIDDYLPTKNNKLIYMHSEERNEFWTALLEKAYAKLNGSYEALSGGLTSEALTDFTGGFVERHDLGPKIPPYMYQLMLKACKSGALMGCSITGEGGKIEGQLSNGLITGHAYSITDVRTINSQSAGEVSMVRVRNPWGDSHEWKGAWSDGSAEWTSVSTQEKISLGLSYNHDGEFWMCYEDFVRNYDQLEICYLGPDSVEDLDLPKGGAKFEGCLFEDGWRQRVNAGGCKNNVATFWTNPQYRITVVDPDEYDDNGNGTILVGLMQRNRRQKKKEGVQNLPIGYAIFKAPESVTGRLDKQFFQSHQSSAKSSNFIDLREVTEHHKLPPGQYIVVPSTFDPNQEGEFVLRIFSETKVQQAQSLDEETGISDTKPKEKLGGKSEEEKANKEEGKQAFLELAGADGEIDGNELQKILNQVFTKVFKFDGFSVDMARSMVAMRDQVDYTGKLGFDDFKKLWSDLTICKKAFTLVDTDKTGYFSGYELRSALSALGLRVSNATLNAIVIRYSDKDGAIRFDDFVALYIRLKTLFEQFKTRDQRSTGRAHLSLDEFTMTTMYS